MFVGSRSLAGFFQASAIDLRDTLVSHRPTAILPTLVLLPPDCGGQHNVIPYPLSSPSSPLHHPPTYLILAIQAWKAIGNMLELSRPFGDKAPNMPQDPVSSIDRPRRHNLSLERATYGMVVTLFPSALTRLGTFGHM